MSNAFRTLMVPASMAATALAITNALGSGHPGMFTTKVWSPSVYPAGWEAI